MLAELRGWSAFVGLQIRYSLLDRTAERDLLPMARTLDLTVTPWDTLGSGILSGKYNRDDSTLGRAKLRGKVGDHDLSIAAEVIKIADEIGRTPAQVALNWVRQGEGVIVPLVGARTREQLDENLGCLEFELEAEQKQRLDDASRIELGFPHDFLREMIPRAVENHRN
jgi:aryl-alcohol dehydrogenase-like predicted oxidoreductase